MFDERNNEEKRITGRILKHSVAFGEHSSAVLNDAVEEVKRLSARGDLYPPDFPTVRYSRPKSSVQLSSSSMLRGKISPAEAAAMKFLQDESSALAQSFARDWETTRKLQEALQLPKKGWQSDTIDGIGEFGTFLGIAAGVREQISSGEGKPKGKTIGDKLKRSWFDKFAEPIQQDQMVLGKNTAKAVQEAISEFTERDIPNVPEGARTEEEIQARIASKKYGAQKAANLYLETLGLASRILPLKLEPRKVEPVTPRRLSGK